MSHSIHTFHFSLPFHMGSVNCYLLEGPSGFLLVDSGGSNNRQALLDGLNSAGCTPGKLRLILITHGDFDHTGNAAAVRQAFGGQIAMHAADAPMAEIGDMFANRKPPHRLLRLLLPAFSGFGAAQRFKPDLLLEDGQVLSPYGFEGRVLSIPGHSKGSLGLLMDNGDFFCGDLLTGTSGPALNSLIDNLAEASASLEKLASLQIGTVYPGHGEPFCFETFIQAYQVVDRAAQ
jgi:glyoxylase-like metal-dependent hydrolase (beta-lactamase superfamily II)